MPPTTTPAAPEQKLTSDQFAEKIKAQYPQYQKVDNSTLTQKMLAKYPQYSSKVNTSPSFDIPNVQGGTVGGNVLNAGIDTVNTANNFVGGAVSDIMNAGYGAGILATKAAGALGVPGATEYAKEREANNPITAAAQPMTSTLPGKIGQVGGEAMLFAAPSGLITKGQKVLTAGADALKFGGEVLPWIATKIAQVLPEVAGSGSTQFVKSGGDSKSAEQAGIGAGILSTLTHVGADAFNSLIPQGVKDNVSGFLKYTGKTALKDIGTAKKVDDATSAFTTMVRQAPQVTVTDINGVTKPWNPAKTSIAELPQVLFQVKNNIYKAYTQMATAAGDEGAMIGQKEFNALKSSLKKFNGAGYSAQESAQAQKWISAINRYGKVNPADGNIYFKNTSPDAVQTLLETVNKHADPRVQDTATATVANDLATTLRKTLDDKITEGTGAGYQTLRTAYSQLKSVEKDIIERAKPALRQTGHLPSDFIDGLASIDVLQGVLTGNAGVAARGLSIAAVKNFVKFLRSPDIKMQRAFKLLQNGPGAEAPSGLTQRFLGGPSEGLTPTALAAGATLAAPAAAATAP